MVTETGKDMKEWCVEEVKKSLSSNPTASTDPIVQGAIMKFQLTSDQAKELCKVAIAQVVASSHLPNIQHSPPSGHLITSPPHHLATSPLHTQHDLTTSPLLFFSFIIWCCEVRGKVERWS